MKKIFCLLVLWIWLLPASGSGFVLGGSNFGSFIYPDHTCGVRPMPPDRPSQDASRVEIDVYNEAVRDYNRELKEFADCINEYIQNASNDMQRIREKAEKASEEMNNPME